MGELPLNRRRYTEAIGLVAGAILVVGTILYPLYWGVVRIGKAFGWW